MKHFTHCLTTGALLFALHGQAADLAPLNKAAQAEGEVNSIGMPDSWANWKDTWAVCMASSIWIPT